VGKGDPRGQHTIRTLAVRWLARDWDVSVE
jgi:hypothetical protein